MLKRQPSSVEPFFFNHFPTFLPVASQITDTIGLTAEYIITEYAIMPLIALYYSFDLVPAVEAP
jgi:hypothetical protein